VRLRRNLLLSLAGAVVFLTVLTPSGLARGLASKRECGSVEGTRIRAYNLSCQAESHVLACIGKAGGVDRAKLGRTRLIYAHVRYGERADAG
jgi:hypothetical protein